MKANEMMIGDWVYNTHNQQPEQVFEIVERMVMLAYNDLYNYDEIEPIPLTPEILEKNGFGSLDESGVSYRIDAAKRMSLSVLGKDAYIDDMDASYVHQLQHALRLCGIEKEIEL